MIRRNTNQRNIVYDSLEYLGHASTEVLIEYINKNHPDFSLATIYRNIKVLTDEHKIKKVKLDGIDVYETIKNKHYHYKCMECGEIYDVKPEEIEYDMSKISSINSDNICDCDIVFYGVCHKCKSVN